MDSLTRLFYGLRNRHFFIFDAVAFLLLPVLAIAIRLDGNMDLAQFGVGLFAVMVTFTAIKLTLFYFSGMYQRYWRYASIDEAAYIGVLTGVAVVMQTFAFIGFYHIQFLPFSDIPRSVPLIDGMLTFLYVGGIRMSIRLSERSKERTTRSNGARTLIVGAGKAGVSLVSEMQRNPGNGYRPVAFVDDDPKKLGLYIRGLGIVGGRNDIPAIVKKYKVSKVITAMPTAPGQDIREVFDICKGLGVEVNTLPSIFEIINGKVKLDSIREIRIEDLLRRDPVKTNISKVASFISGKRVLVTGGGGSIGSEICRQILNFSPEEIGILDHGENAAFDIQQELLKSIHAHRNNGRREQPFPEIKVYIADIRSVSRLKVIFEQFKPDIIFHAAAHKHVPMMEENVSEAVSNNIFGTRNLLYLSSRFGIKHFVNISTDKAVNPSSIMGATKRVSETQVLQAAKMTGNQYVCVRFGNVLGSNGSVIPTFKRQILQGGPVTVTHPDIKRYFMTIPEAVQLVLQASVIGDGGEIFVLDMGEAIRISDLAKDLIKLSGLECDSDIRIEYTGLRPGEKLFEELFIPGEEYAQTEHEKILIACNASQVIPNGLDDIIEDLHNAAKRDNAVAVKLLLHKLLPEYTNGVSVSGNGRHNGNDKHNEDIPENGGQLAVGSGQ